MLILASHRCFLRCLAALALEETQLRCCREAHGRGELRRLLR